MNTNNKMICFLDTVGRTIFAEKVEGSRNENSDSLVVKNPVVVHINSGPDGQMSLSLIPCFFREFLADKTQDTTWSFNMAAITLMDPTEFDEKLYKNYANLNSNIVVPTALDTAMATKSKTNIPNGEKVIKLFDEK